MDVNEIPIIKIIDRLDMGDYKEYSNDDKEYLIIRLKWKKLSSQSNKNNKEE